ncbi:MAG TPA: DNA ligase D [Candidatus Limnocylindrales bacterium]|nr:DNA ligase D [Candidatus Limnocylindrales bacterium]
MPLETYRKKRDFERTPEPAGAPKQRATARGGRFVVQRHRATRLHYDFRLEIGGVLVSWAVAKGPTMDPGVRRMAVHVEDHPIEYLDFEGTIPKGQYGGGDVIVWDWGTFEAESEAPDPERAIADGELKFTLGGEKLKGRFTIVRTSGRGRGRRTGTERAFEADEGDQWLLIKKRDADAVAGWDPEDHPRSVKTGRTNDEVAANADAVWLSGAPAATAEIDLSAAEETGAAGYLEPMAATLASKPFDDPDWLFEVKWDGYRVEAVVRDGRARLFTRHGNDAATYFPSLAGPAPWIDARDAVVDGEVVALDERGRPDFSLLQQRISAATGGKVPGMRGRSGGGGGGDGSAPEEPGRAPLVYEVFDLLHHDGRSLLKVPLEDRKRLLRAVLRDHPRVRFADHVVADGKAFYEAARRQKLEGMVAKHRRSRYEPGRRTQTWLKIKLRPEQELVVGGWTPGEGNAKDLGAVVVGVYDGDAFRYAGKVGSGFNAKTRASLRSRLDALASDDCPFTPCPERKGELRTVRWVRPDLVIRAELGGWTRDNLVRQTSYKGIDEGHDPRLVVREREVDTATAEAAADDEVEREEEAAAVVRKAVDAERSRDEQRRGEDGLAKAALPEELEALAEMRKDGVWRVGDEELKVTNLDKVLFPGREAQPGSPTEEPVTKRDLIAYFARIAPAMLPHLAERPLNLHRYPNGAGAPGFWQKDMAPSTPDWVRIWHETGVEDRRANDHVVADRVATLCYLGNLAAFEIHAWTSSIADPSRPTFALIDVDPGENTTWDETLTLTRLYRTALEHLGVRGYPKTTGRRGIQVWIPIEPRYSFAETSAWVEGISRAIGSMVPDLVSWEWAKSARGGKARLDYTQNAPIKTLVAPYAVRPAAAAPVSAPIRWDELDDPDLRPDRWTIRTIVGRVDELGDLFAPAQADVQVLPKLG